MSELYDDGSSVEPIEITLDSGHRVTGTGYLPWGIRRRVSARSDGTFEGFLDALVKVWIPLEGTDWDILVKDPKSGSIVKLPRTEEVIDGLTQPCLSPDHVAKIGLELGKRLYPDTYPWELLGVSAEGESSAAPTQRVPGVAEVSPTAPKTSPRKPKNAARSS